MCAMKSHNDKEMNSLKCTHTHTSICTVHTVCVELFVFLFVCFFFTSTSVWMYKNLITVI